MQLADYISSARGSSRRASRYAGVRLVGCALLGILAGLGGCKSKTARKQREKPAVVVVESEDELDQESLREREPNDSAAQAQPLALGETVAGTLRSLQGQPDRDWFRLSIEGGVQVLRLESSGAAKVDQALVLRDAQGKQLIRVDNTGVGGGESLVNALVEAGEYLVEMVALSADAGAKADERRYRLRVTTRAVELSEEREPNGEADRASRLSWDGEIAGYCGWRKDIDWYKVELPDSLEGALLRFELDGIDGVRPRLDLKLEGNKTHVQRSAHARGDAVVLANVRPPAASAELFAVVHCGKGYNLDTRYALRVSSTAAAGMEHEPNDTPATAVPVEPGASVRGVLADRSDRDVFRPGIPAGALVRLSARPPAGLDLALALVDGEGAVLQEVDEGRSGAVEVIVPHVWTNGSFVRLRAPQASAVDSLAPYRLSVEVLEGSDWEREPNDLPGRASRWPPGRQLMRGYLHPKTDVDHYRLTSDNSTLQLAIRMPGGGELVAELLDGQTVVESVALPAGASRGLLEAQVTIGRPYLLRVHGAAEGHQDRAYQLEKITLAPVGPAPTPVQAESEQQQAD